MAVWALTVMNNNAAVAFYPGKDAAGSATIRALPCCPYERSFAFAMRTVFLFPGSEYSHCISQNIQPTTYPPKRLGREQKMFSNEQAPEILYGLAKLTQRFAEAAKAEAAE